MSNEHNNLITALRYNIQQLISKYESEKHERESALAEVSRVQRELMHAHKDILELQQKYDNLRLVQNTSLSEDERKTANKRLQRMMREIDKCIALLNE
ncbi:MAG: hypothetical protein LBR75_01730 [Prevotellaceae bacterium]|jgi:hypothetical protein|nr:hypothetical protein [Prevotellaceae bacterium]